MTPNEPKEEDNLNNLSPYERSLDNYHHNQDVRRKMEKEEWE